MASTSQTYATMPEDQLAELLSNVKSLRETEALRARLPAQLAPFASNISITKPVEIISTSPPVGINGSYFIVNERRISMSVAVVPSPPSHSQSQGQGSAGPADEPPRAKKKPLELIYRDWMTRTLYVSGAAESEMLYIFLHYGDSGDATRSRARAFSGRYSDPQIRGIGYSHGRIKSVVGEVARDMGLREGELENKLEMIDALLGDDGKELLDSPPWEGPREPLRKVIEDELEMKECYY